jgi:hypothetical protein
LAATTPAHSFAPKDGFITGAARKLKEFTITGGYRFIDNFCARLEYRRGWSGQAVFERDSVTCAAKSQDTLVTGMAAHFPPHGK